MSSPPRPHPFDLGDTKSRPTKGPTLSYTTVHKKPIYCCSFSSSSVLPADDQNLSSDDEDSDAPPESRGSRYFAVCGQNVASIYRVDGGALSSSSSPSSPSSPSPSPLTSTLVQTYTGSKGEDWYCCSFGGLVSSFVHNANDTSGTTEDGRRKGQLLALAGAGRCISIIDPYAGKLVASLIGHGDEIYEMTFVPIGVTNFSRREMTGSLLEGSPTPCVDDFLLLSASKDESIRLWNVQTGACLLMFAGDMGHRESVLSIDVHPLGHSFVSGGMDTTIKLWRLEDDAVVRDVVAASDKSMITDIRRTTQIQLPYFSTNHAHTDYADCVRFLGDCIVSKSTANLILLWKPVLGEGGRAARACEKNSDAIIPLREFVLSNCDVWFVRHSVSDDMRSLAVGNKQGMVKVWSVEDPEEPPKTFATTVTGGRSVIRTSCFSREGDIMVATCDNGTVWLYEV